MRPDPSGLLNIGLMVLLALLGMTVSVATIRVFFGPTLPDRVIALDLVAFATVAMIGAYAIATGRGTLLDVALVLSLLMFLGTVAFARFFEQSASGRKSSP